LTAWEVKFVEFSRAASAWFFSVAKGEKDPDDMSLKTFFTGMPHDVCPWSLIIFIDRFPLKETEDELRRVLETGLPWEPLHVAQLALEAYCLLELSISQLNPTTTTTTSSSSRNGASNATLSKTQKKLQAIVKTTAWDSLSRIATMLAKQAKDLKDERSVWAKKLSMTELRSLPIVGVFSLSLSGFFFNNNN
jgi:hypothetical protein